MPLLLISESTYEIKRDGITRLHGINVLIFFLKFERKAVFNKSQLCKQKFGLITFLCFSPLSDNQEVIRKSPVVVT